MPNKSVSAITKPLSGTASLKSAPKIQLPAFEPPPTLQKDLVPPPLTAAPPAVLAEALPPAPEAVQAAWDEFAEAYKQKDKPLVVSMLSWKPVTFRYPVITHALRGNATDADAFKEVRHELLAFLKKRLQCPQLVIETVEAPLTELLSAPKIYTNTEKFNFLAEKYPLLNELRQILGLDTD